MSKPLKARVKPRKRPKRVSIDLAIELLKLKWHKPRE
jgi:hypothetical protein